MKKHSFSLCIGILIGLFAGSVSGAFAAVGETVEAQFAKFTLIINDGEQKEIEPLTYKGSTYLQVREVSNMLGYDLTYKADNRTIELNKSMDSMISEMQEITSTGSEEVIESVENKSIEEQLKEVNDTIERTKSDLYAHGVLLETITDGGFKEDVINEVKGNIEKAKQKLSELESRKAELEAQLQSQTP